MKLGDTATPRMPYRSYRRVELLGRLQYTWLMRICENRRKVGVHESEFETDQRHGTMKGEQQEERVPNSIDNAVTILTASHLSCEVEMLATAQEVWRTKRLPEAVLLDTCGRIAHDVMSAVRKRGLAEQADRLGEIFYGTGELPLPEEDNA